jgi:hypothetical protein
MSGDDAMMGVFSHTPYVTGSRTHMLLDGRYLIQWTRPLAGVENPTSDTTKHTFIPLRCITLG